MAANAISFEGLYDVFAGSAQRVGPRPALVVGGRSYSYAELEARASGLAATILAHEARPNPLVAFLAHKSITAYSAVLGILATGKGYVPLHPKFPVQRTRQMLERSGAETLIADPDLADELAALLACVDRPLTVILPSEGAAEPRPGNVGGHTVVRAAPVSRHERPRPAGVAPDSVAYLLFTSGSTGVPKGVPISQRNVMSYVRFAGERYGIRDEDRCSQTFDLTFDLSVHDMFVCWANGASLYALPDQVVMAPARFIRQHELTAWFSVPSLIGFMQRMRLLKPESLPSLRLSLFCGEPLPASSAAAWQAAAPNSIVENVYGPTEATIAISHFRWQPEFATTAFVNGIVPIGTIFSSQSFCVIDRESRVVPPGEAGELCLSGSQVAGGYLDDPERTGEQFVTLAGQGDARWYRTGDLAREDETGCLHYLGRIDNQIQVRGHRVELQEVDHVLREASGSAFAIAVAWPMHESSAEAVYGFVSGGDEINAEEIKSRCGGVLPEYMVPRRIFVVDKMPLNVNGKIDRKALTDRVEELLRDGSS